MPLPVEWDYRHMVALLELGRLLNDHARSSDPSSGDGFRLPPVTALTCVLQLLVFFKPGGVLLREVSISPYCVVDKKQYYRCSRRYRKHSTLTACCLQEDCRCFCCVISVGIMCLCQSALGVITSVRAFCPLPCVHRS